MWKYISAVIFAILMIGCHKKEENITSNQTFEVAKNIQINEDSSHLTIESNGNSVSIPSKDLPLSNIMVETSSAIAFLSELDGLSTLKGVIDPNFIYHPLIQEKINNKEIITIGNSNELYLEVILKQKPQLIIASSNPMLAKYHQHLEQNGIKILYLDEYKELDPIAQVEYLKIFGKLIGKEQFAEERFKDIQTNYKKTKQLIQNQGKVKLSTLVNNLFGDVWYMPSKNSLQAKLIDDAQGNYIFNDQKGETALHLTFEEVYQKGKNATHWINVMNFTSLEQMKAAYPNYTWFDAFKNGKVFTYDVRSNEYGANDIFEQGIIRPDIILSDLGKIFYPDLFTHHQFYFYHQLK